MSEFNFNASLDLTELINVLNQEYDFTRITDEVLDEIDYDQIKSDVLSDIDYDQIKNEVIEDIDTDKIADIVKSEIDYDSIVDDVMSNLDGYELWTRMDSYASDAFNDEVESLLRQYIPGNGCRTGNLFTSAVNEAIGFLLKDDIAFQNEIRNFVSNVTASIFDEMAGNLLNGYAPHIPCETGKAFTTAVSEAIGYLYENNLEFFDPENRFDPVDNDQIEEAVTIEEYAPPTIPEIPTELVNLYTRPDVLTIVDEVARRVSDRTGSATQYELRVMMQDAVIAILNERGNNA